MRDDFDKTEGVWAVVAFIAVMAILTLYPGCAIARAADATEHLAKTIEAKVVPAVVTLAESATRSTDALGDAWDWLRAQAAWAGWLALLSTWPYRWVRRLFVRKRQAKRLAKKD